MKTIDAVVQLQRADFDEPPGVSVEAIFTFKSPTDLSQKLTADERETLAEIVEKCLS